MAQSGDTTCSPRTLPWATSFEENEAGLDCWTVMLASSTTPFISQYAATSTGSRALWLAARGAGERLLLATPRMACRADSLHVGFHLTQTAEVGVLQAGLVSDTTDTASFTPLLTVDLTAADTGYYEFYANAACGTDSLWVAFRLVDGMVHLDDLTVQVATDCRRPQSPWVGSVGITTVAFGWSSGGGTATTYLVRCTDVAAGTYSDTTVAATSCTLAGLTPGTTYRIAVAALCGSDTTAWLPIGTVATDVTCRTPLDAAVADITTQAAAIAWTYDTLGVAQPTGMLVRVDDLTSGLTGTWRTTTDSYIFFDSLNQGHHYQAVLRTVCSSDTALPLTIAFVPLAEACSEVTGRGISSSLPLSSLSAYSYSQMLYPSSALAGMDTLYAVAFRVVSGTMPYPRQLDVYVGSTADSTLTDNVSTLMAVKAANGYTFVADGWSTVVFDMPVRVDTSLNMLLTVVDNTGMPSSPLYFGTHNGEYGGSLYGTSPLLPFNPATSELSLFSTSATPDLRLYGNCPVGTCMPSPAVVSDVTDTTVTIVAAHSPAVVRHRAAGTEAWSTAIPFSHSVTLTLNPSTYYEFQVGVVCMADTAFGTTLTAMTSCGTVAVPYVADFSAGGHPCWQGVQRPASGGVLVGDALSSPEMAVAPSTAQVSMMLGGEGSVYVGVCDDADTLPTWLDTIDVDWTGFAWSTAYLLGYNGIERHVVLSSSGTVTVQRVAIEPLDACLPPRHLAVTAVTGDGATLQWRGLAGQTFAVHLRVTGGDEWASWSTTASQLTLGGLQPVTAYEGYVEATCDADGSDQIWFSFVTSCQAISILPFVEDFEDELVCWNVAYADPACATVNPVTLVSGHAHGGSRSLRFGSYNNVASGVYNQYIVTPRIMADDSITVSFYYTKDHYASEPFALGVSASSSSLQNFIWYSPVEPEAGSWQRFEMRLPSAVRYVALQYMGQDNYYLYIDDFTIEGAGCAAPVITAVDEQSDHVAIRWQGDGDSARVAITDGLWLSDVEGTAVAGRGYTFSGLQPGRTYTVGVRCICPDGHLSEWTTHSVVTIDTACAPPASLVVDSIGYTIADLSWTAGDARQWQLCLVADGELLEVSQPLSTTSCRITDLEAGKDYGVMVRSLCSDIPGPWSDTLHLHTADCLPVGEVGYERVDFRTVTLSWTPAPVTTGQCLVEYGVHGFERGTGRTVVATGESITVGNLEPEPDYDFYIQNYCETGVLSDSAVLLTVPTGVGIDENSELGVRNSGLTVYPNPACGRVTVRWQLGVGNWELAILDINGRSHSEYKVQNTESTIDISGLAPGAYFVRAVGAAGVAVTRLVVR